MIYEHIYVLINYEMKKQEVFTGWKNILEAYVTKLWQLLLVLGNC